MGTAYLVLDDSVSTFTIVMNSDAAIALSAGIRASRELLLVILCVDQYPLFVSGQVIACAHSCIQSNNLESKNY
jgi:hypothetical protein